MTTSLSPLSRLKAQADNIARIVKAIERGEDVIEDRGGKIAASRALGRTKFAIVMDDKIISVEMSWATIAESSETEISSMILGEMRGSRQH